MQVIETALPGVLIVEPTRFGDARGAFMEVWNARRYSDAGIPDRFVQDNISRSTRGVLRGLHMQHPDAQGKLVQVLDGEVFDAAVDVRVDSEHFGRWTATVLSADNARQMWVPPGFLHGFCVLSETALFAYKCSDYYARESELGVAWDDPDIGIDWPVDSPVLSAKDAGLRRLCDIPSDRLPRLSDYESLSLSTVDDHA